MKKVILILFSMVFLFLFVGCDGNIKENSTSSQNKIMIKSNVEKDISNQILIADKQAHNNNYFDAFGILQKVKVKYDLEKNDYDGLGKLIDMKETQYDIKGNLKNAVDNLNDRDYFSAPTYIGQLFEKYPNSTETKDILIPLMVKIAEKEFSKGNFDLELANSLGVGNKVYGGKDSRIANIFIKYNKNIGSLSKGFNMNIPPVTDTPVSQPIKDPSLGMINNEVKQSSWGEPTHIDKITNNFGNYEIWYYSSGKAVWFKDGKVTDIYDQIK